MHKYRAACHREGWYDDGPHNILFKKYRRPSGALLAQSDVENPALYRNKSESYVRTAIEQDRRRNGKHSVSGPLHANSMPLAVNGIPPSLTSTTSPTSATSSNDREFCSPLMHKQTEQTESSQDYSEENNESGNVPRSNKADGQSRKRKGWHPFSKQNQERPEPQPRSSSFSKSSRREFTFIGQLRATLFNSWLNVLFIFIPVGIAVHFIKASPVIVFVMNFIAIIPLAAMLSYATEEIALRTGETIGGLLNASFGNAVELIVSVIALVHNEVIIVQTSLIGSMLSNLLLVLGMCFFFGGINRKEQFFNVTVAQTAASLLSLAIASLIIPTAFESWSSGTAGEDKVHITALSRGTAILLLIVYGAYLYFQLKTHTDMYNEPSKKVAKRAKVGKGDANKGLANIGAGISASAGGGATHQTPVRYPDEEEQDEVEEPQLSILVAILTLLISTALVGICAEFLVDSINELVEIAHLSKTFVGLILLPIVGNAAEHATAVTVAIKDKMDLAIGVAVGSSMQIALLIVPFAVVLGWCLGNDTMNLGFDGFQIAVLFVSVLLVNYLIADGKSHWLEGVLLMTLYLIIAIAAWYYPAKEDGNAAARLRL